MKKFEERAALYVLQNREKYTDNTFYLDEFDSSSLKNLKVNQNKEDASLLNLEFFFDKHGYLKNFRIF